jgi:RNA polymerase sigma-54 factor
MALTPRLDLRQSQALVMTPQLQQAIKLLQLNNLDLAAYVEQELEQNPLLEREDAERDLGDGETPEGEAAEGEKGGESERDGLEAVDVAAAGTSPEAAQDKALDVDYDNLWNNDSPADVGVDPETAFATWGSRGGNASFDDAENNLEQTLSSEETLRDHLLAQINLELADPVDRVIALHLVDMLDEAGYVTGDLDGLAVMLNCGADTVRATLAKVQRFDPPGIFATSLAECLSLQLRERDRLDPAMQALLAHLDLLARRDTQGLMRVCGVDAEDLVEMVAEIRALNPKPALAFDHMVAQPVTPDVLMRPNPNGGWVVELNNETLPRVLVNNRYYARVNLAARSKEERQYIAERLQSANWLVKSLHQRATTILKVATEIVRQQDRFFTHGVQHLKPLVLRDIATAIDMHESTVSRVTSNKYIATPRGIYELKYFFTPAINSSAGGDAHSAEAVRHRIRALVDAEPADAPLSDDKLVEILRKEGIDIARRTVAKYREAMHIASSVQRRREKSAGI